MMHFLILFIFDFEDVAFIYFRSIRIRIFIYVTTVICELQGMTSHAMFLLYLFA